MGIVDDIWNPQSFLGLTDLRSGSFILAAVNFILSALTFLGLRNGGIVTLGTIIALICTGLGVYGIIQDNKSYVHIYEIYLIFEAFFAVFVFFFSFFSFSLTYIFASFISFIIALYSCRVVRAYYKGWDNEPHGTTTTTEPSAKVAEATNKV